MEDNRSQVAIIPRKKLAITAIFGNEEKWVKQWCESILKANPDLIIINLTQYDDNTENLLKEYLPSDQFIFMKHPWQKNFSEARNHTLAAIPDWIDYSVFVDADEVFTDESYEMLDAFLRQDFPPHIIMLNIYNKMTTEGMQASLYYPRMFPHKDKNGKIFKYHFESAVHNQLIFEDKTIEALRTPLSLYHYGYALSDEDMAKKHQRTEELLRNQIAENGEDFFAYVNLAQLLRAKQEYEEALFCAKEAMRIVIPNVIKKDKKATDIFIMAKEQATTCYMSLNRWQEAVNEAEDLLKLKQDHLDSLFNLGNIYFNLGDLETSKFWFNRYLFIRRNYDENYDDTNIIQNHLNSTFLALFNLGIIEANLNNHEKAADYFHKSYKENNEFFDSALKYLHTLSIIDQGKFQRESSVIIQERPEKAHIIYDLYTNLAISDLNIEQAKLFAYQAAHINSTSPESPIFVKKWESLYETFGDVSKRFFDTKKVAEQFNNKVRA